MRPVTTTPTTATARAALRKATTRIEDLLAFDLEKRQRKSGGSRLIPVGARTDPGD